MSFRRARRFRVCHRRALAAAGWLAISALVSPRSGRTARSHDVRAGHHALAALARGHEQAQAGHHAPSPLRGRRASWSLLGPTMRAWSRGPGGRALGVGDRAREGDCVDDAELNAQGEPGRSASSTRLARWTVCRRTRVGTPSLLRQERGRDRRRGDRGASTELRVRAAAPGCRGAAQDVPFKWVRLNWKPHGHIPHGDSTTRRTSTWTSTWSRSRKFRAPVGPRGRSDELRPVRDRASRSVERHPPRVQGRGRRGSREG